ncbi:conserved hypothetical protein [Vibrio diabolicus]|nr:conserved hypothetical protein [Vibrio diabolicus]
MRFFCDENDDALTARANQFTLSALRECLVQIGKKRLIVEVSLQLRSHEKVATGIINKFVIVNDVELVLVTDISDFRDETRGVRTVGQQCFLFHKSGTSMH